MESVERVKPVQAAKELNVDIETLHFLLREGSLPIGHAFKREGKKRYTYIIYRGLLDAHKKKISGGDKEAESEEKELGNQSFHAGNGNFVPCSNVGS